MSLLFIVGVIKTKPTVPADLTGHVGSESRELTLFSLHVTEIY